MQEVSLAEVVGRVSDEPGRRSRRKLEKRRRKRRRRTGLVILLALLLLGGAMGGAWAGLRPLVASLTAPNDYPGPGSGSVEVKIIEGATGTAIGGVLQRNGVVLTVKGFTTAYRANPRSATIQPGTYALKQKMSSASAVEALLDADNRVVDRVTLAEGVRLADIPKIIAARTRIPLADLQAALQAPAALGLPPEAKGDLQGWIFPATYDVHPGTTATELLREMVAKTVRELDALGVPAAERRQTIVLASLIQAEAKLPADFPKVSRVLYNRLAKGVKLQLDATVHFATGTYRIDTSVKDTEVVSPYNTYAFPGLPVGAIDNPGRAAIEAARAPADGPWLYFVTVNPESGETKYATTEAEFAVIKAEFDAWVKAHPGK